MRPITNKFFERHIRFKLFAFFSIKAVIDNPENFIIKYLLLQLPINQHFGHL